LLLYDIAPGVDVLWLAPACLIKTPVAMTTKM